MFILLENWDCVKNGQIIEANRLQVFTRKWSGHLALFDVFTRQSVVNIQ